MEGLVSSGGMSSLSRKDALVLLELIHRVLLCADMDEFGALVERLRDLVPFDFAICVLGRKDPAGKVTFCSPVNINYPPEWIDLYLSRNYQLIDPVARENFGRFRLQRWAETYRRCGAPRDFLSLAEDFGLKDGYTHGVRNARSTLGSLFSLSGPSVEYNDRNDTILELIVPHLHQSLVRISGRENGGVPPVLSPREKEVMTWIREGKSNWEISAILGCSERTVKFHVSNVMKKLDAVTRTQAVAIAVERGLIDTE